MPFLGLIACTTALLAAAAGADEAVLFERDVQPIFARRCAGCHSPEAESLKAKLDLSTAERALRGGESGPSILSGDAENSPLVAMLEHRTEPFMPPPKKFDALPPEEIAIIRAWIDGGALSSGGAPAAPAAPAAAKEVPPAHAAPVSAAAYAPGGGTLALGSLRAVTLYEINPETGTAARAATLEGHAEQVRALAYSPDGAILAAAGGNPGRGGEIIFWNTADHSRARRIEGHRDAILDAAFSPDGTRLVTCSYDKLAKVWNAADGAELHTLKDHVDAVYAVAWSPDGALIATGAGDRTIKLWDAATGERILTFSEATDAIQCLVFTPDSRLLAGGAADKMIRVWDVAASKESFTQTATSKGVVVASTFAHDGAVLELAYAPDGLTIFSTGEDRRIKAWDAATLLERFNLEAQPDWVMAMALSPGGRFLAAGRYDGTSAIYDAASGAEIWPEPESVTLSSAVRTGGKRVNVDAVHIVASIPSSLSAISPVRHVRGAVIDVTVDGKNLADAEPFFHDPAIGVELVKNEALPVPEFTYSPDSTGAQIHDNAVPHRLTLKVTIPEDAAPGAKHLFCRTPRGLTNDVALFVLSRSDIGEAEPNDAPETAQALDAFPVTLLGGINSSGDRDCFRVQGAPGRELVFAMTDAGFSPLMRLLAPEGIAAAASADFGGGRDARLAHRFTNDRVYVLEVSDPELKANVYYRLHVGEFPLVQSVFPIGIQSGGPQSVAVSGFNLGGANVIQVTPPNAARPWTTMALPVPAMDGNVIPAPKLGVAPYPAAVEAEPNDSAAQAQWVEFPSVTDGRIEDGPDVFRFHAEAGQTLLLEIMAARLGSPLDAIIEVLGADGAPLQRALVRCVSRTFTTLSERDSRSGGFRLDAWSDFRINDYLMAGSEIVRIRSLPDYNDEDLLLQVWPDGSRRGWFGTTPEYHAVGTPVYKVELHAPGTELPPNGMPVFPLYWRNDDAFFEGQRSGDAQLEFTAPAAGEYLARVRDAAGAGGAEYAYRLMLRERDPEFEVSIAPYRVNVHEGGRVPVEVRVRRLDGFDAPVEVRVHGLPEGLQIGSAMLGPNEEVVQLPLEAARGAESTGWDPNFKVTASAAWNGETRLREAGLGTITVVKRQPDLVVHAEPRELALKPGGKIALAVRVERFNGFNERIPIDVLNLPFGVRVLDTGLNGILVRAGEHERTVEIYAEPWVEAMTRAIFVQARIESPSPGRMLFLGPPISLVIGGGPDAALQTASAGVAQ